MGTIITKINVFDGEHKFLSNFYQCKPIRYEGITYATTECAYQAAKFNDPVLKKYFSTLKPWVAKKEGRRFPIRKDWEEVKVGVMEDLVRLKFSQPEMKKKLLDTGDAELVEGNTWGDTFWGVDLSTGKGQNHLGKILMKIRQELSK